jgi:hypothetical protein
MERPKGYASLATGSTSIREGKMLGLILVIILVLLLLGVIPTSRSRGWGYFPGSTLFLILIVVLILWLLGVIWPAGRKPDKRGVAIMPKNRSFLKYVAVILFVLAAIFLFAIHSISTNTDLGLIAIGLATFALA